MKPTCLLLPGNMCDARLWSGGDSVLIEGLARGNWPYRTPALDADTIAAMAAGVLAETQGPLLPVGFSMGGIVALELARQAPERVVALALLDTNAAADLPERAAARPRQQAEVMAGKLETVVVEELKPNYLAQCNRGNRVLRELLRDMAMALGPEVFVRQSEALRTRPDLTSVLSTFAGPVFLACGEEDRLCPPEWHQRWATLASRPELHVVPGAGHMLPLERPRHLAALLGNWLSKLKEPAYA